MLKTVCETNITLAGVQCGLKFQIKIFKSITDFKSFFLYISTFVQLLNRIADNIKIYFHFVTEVSKLIKGKMIKYKLIDLGKI